MAWVETARGELQIATPCNPRELLSIAFPLNLIDIIIPENSQSQWPNPHTKVQKSLNDRVERRRISELPEFYFGEVYSGNVAK
jgi:hypothetical protein